MNQLKLSVLHTIHTLLKVKIKMNKFFKTFLFIHNIKTLQYNELYFMTMKKLNVREINDFNFVDNNSHNLIHNANVGLMVSF